LLDAGACLAFGSDWWVAPIDPIAGIYAATTRRPIDGSHPGGWVPEQKISAREAVHAYTVGSAFASFQDHLKGSLAPGKLADLVVLSQDIFTLHPEEILEAKVDMTLLGGEIVYDRKATG
jgi:predicted amidohydrolase YtcJ